MNTAKCPKCGAELQEGARFCPHCMAQLDEKQNIEKPKAKLTKSRKAKIIITVLLAVVLIISGVTGAFLYNKKHSSLCTFEQFQAQTLLVSDKMGVNSLWDVDGFIDTHELKDENIIMYSTPLYLDGAEINLFFFNDGEEVYSYISDVKESDFESAQELCKCVAQSVCNYYFTDIDDVFENESIYPKKQIDEPFLTDFTDVLSRTKQYNADIASGAEITTKYIQMASDEFLINYYITQRSDSAQTLYDFTVQVGKR